MTKLVHNTTNRGFTLIELLIVVAIIAILAAIAVPNFLEAQTRSKISRVKSDMRTIVTATEVYHLDNNAFPTGFGLSVSDTDRWRFGLWLLSTPIAYISDANLQDPMEKRFVPPQHPTESTIQYNAVANDGGTNRRGVILSEFLRFTGRAPQGTSVVGFGSDGFRLQPGTKATAYMLFSNGPDQRGGFGAFDAANNPEGDVEIRILESDTNPGAFLDVIYDPTNGTLSSGNVWRSGGSDANFAVRVTSQGN
jgi:type II secretion system protein G